MIDFEQWEGFEGRIWKEEVNVRDFIQKNYTPYNGDESFLADPTEATNKLWGALQKLQKAERAKGGVLDMETDVVSSLTAYGPGYIDESLKDLEQIVGLQTDKPLKLSLIHILLVIIALSFRSLSVPVLLVASIEAAIAINMGHPSARPPHLLDGVRLVSVRDGPQAAERRGAPPCHQRV